MVTGLIYMYSTGDDRSAGGSDVLKAIPSDAALIFESKNAADIWRDLSQSSVIWEELQATDLYFRLNAIGHGLDSAMRARPDLRKYLDRKSIAISAHSSGARSYSFLLAMPLRGQAEAGDIGAEIIEIFKPSEPVKSRTYNGVQINTLQPFFADSPISFYVSEGLLIIGLTNILVEESVRALKENAHVLTDAAFLRARETADANARGQLFVHHSRLAAVVKPYTASSFSTSPFFQVPFANWSALDLTMKSNAFMLNGFAQAADSANAWVARFANLKAPEVEVLPYLPSNTAYFAYYGFGDFKAYLQRHNASLEAQGIRYKRVKAIGEIKDQCNCDAEKLALEWMGSQAAVFITEPAQTDYSSNQFALFHTSDKSLADESLQQLAEAFRGPEQEATEGEEFEGHIIQHLQFGSLYGTLLGNAFDQLQNPYAVRIDDMVYFGNSLNSLRLLVQSVDAKRSLDLDESFADVRSQMGAEVHFAFYSAMSRSTYIYEAMLQEKERTSLSERREVVRKFQGFLYAVKHHKNDLYYTNVFFKHNPTYAQETSALWEAKLKAAIAGKFHLVKNHYSNALEVLVQDTDHRIYLLSGTGKILWEATLDGAIQGDVTQIDVFKNRKLQMAMSTATKLYVLDRNGNSIDGYPVALPAKASAAMAVVDYDNSRDYRLFVPLSDGRVMAWDAAGKAVEGWSFTDAEAPITTAIEHIRVRSKDYLFAANAKGKIHLLDRRGNSRHAVDLPIPEGAMKPYRIEHPDQLISSGALHVLDSAGVMYAIGFDSRMERLDLGIKNPRSSGFADLDGDGKMDCVVQLKAGAGAFSLDGKRIFDIMQDDLNAPLQLHQLDGGKTLISAVDKESSKCYLFTQTGQAVEGFPLIGDVLPALGDINGDGNYVLVTGTGDGAVYGYAVQKSW